MNELIIIFNILYELNNSQTDKLMRYAADIYFSIIYIFIVYIFMLCMYYEHTVYIMYIIHTRTIYIFMYLKYIISKISSNSLLIEIENMFFYLFYKN